MNKNKILEEMVELKAEMKVIYDHVLNTKHHDDEECSICNRYFDIYWEADNFIRYSLTEVTVSDANEDVFEQTPVNYGE
jgi:hypothetical protein